MGIISSHIEKRSASMEALMDDRNWMPLFGAKTKSGVEVNEYTAMNYSAVYNAMSFISGAVGSVPLHLFGKLPIGREKLTADNLYYLLHTAANPEMSAMSFRETSISHLLGWGNAYAEKVLNGRGKIVELWPIPPNRVRPFRATENMGDKIKRGDLAYEITVGSEKKYWGRDKMLHIPGYGFDGIVGYSVFVKARSTIGLAMAAEEFGENYFGQGTHPGVVVSHPGKIGDDAHRRLGADLSEKYSGLGKTHRLLLLEEAMKIESIGYSPEDSQFLGTRLYQISEIARWFNLPVAYLKDDTHSTYSNVEHKRIELVADTFRPICVRFEQCYNMQILGRRRIEQGNYYEHALEALLRGDLAAQAEFYRIMWNMGAWNHNMILEKQNENTYEGGDKRYIPANMISVDLADDLYQNEPSNQKSIRAIEHNPTEHRSTVARDRLQKRFHPLIKDAAARVIKRESINIKSAVKKHLRSSADFDAWIDEFYGDLPKYIRAAMGPVLRSFAEAIMEAASDEIGVDFEMTPELETFTEEFLDGYSNRHIGKSIKQLRNMLEDEYAESKIENRMNSWEEDRPDQIANNESTRVNGAFALTVFFAGGYAGVWRTRGKSCPYCDALNGKKIRSGGSFFKGGEDYEPDGAGNGPMKIRGTVRHPPLHASCACAIAAG